MNPIVHQLVQQAVSSFATIPPDRQPMVMQLVAEISQAAQAGDQMKVMQLGMQLQQQLLG